MELDLERYEIVIEYEPGLRRIKVIEAATLRMAQRLADALADGYPFTLNVVGAVPPSRKEAPSDAAV